jgi:hypothetical protein
MVALGSAKDGGVYIFYTLKSFSCLDQFLCMAFAQLTYRESPRETEICLRSQSEKLYHMGIRGGISRNTLSNANKVRDWRIYADFAQALIKIARPLYAKEDLGLELDNTIYALDASTIDLCLSVFPWALFRSTKSAVKLHTLLDLRGNIPTFIHISDGKLHDVNVLDLLIPEPGAFYVMDRGFLDFGRLFSMDQAGAFFIIRAKSNTLYKRRYSHPVSSAAQSSGVKDHRTDWSQRKGRLPSASTTGQISRQQNRQNFQLSDQQFYYPSADSSRPLSLPVAGRAIFQVNQTAPENQIIFRHHRECSKESDLDCHLSLRARSHHQKAAQARHRALHNSTDFEPYTFRENSTGSVTYEIRLQK